MKNEIAEILKRSNLSITENRVRILDFFHHSNGALAHSDIEKLGKDGFDRVTIYRTLQVFLEKGIIHTIPTADNAVLYALCKDDCTEGHHHDNHIHFVCDVCGTAYCLDNTTIPQIKLPNGFTAKQTDIVINGKCNNCN